MRRTDSVSASVVAVSVRTPTGPAWSSTALTAPGSGVGSSNSTSKYRSSVTRIPSLLLTEKVRRNSPSLSSMVSRSYSYGGALYVINGTSLIASSARSTSVLSVTVMLIGMTGLKMSISGLPPSSAVGAVSTGAVSPSGEMLAGAGSLLAASAGIRLGAVSDVLTVFCAMSSASGMPRSVMLLSSGAIGFSICEPSSITSVSAPSTMSSGSRPSSSAGTVTSAISYSHAAV